MTDIEIKSIKALSLLKQDKSNEAYNELVDAYRSIRRNIRQLKDVTCNKEVGEAFLNLCSSKKLYDVDILRHAVNLSYMFISKAINESEDPICYKSRVLLLDNYKDQLRNTVISALNIDNNIFSVLGTMSQLTARDALYKMKYYDLKKCPILKTYDDSFITMECDLDNKISNGFFGSQLDADGIMEEGEDDHNSMLSYIEDMVLNNEDINF